MIFTFLIRDALLADSEGNIVKSCEGKRSSGGISVILGNASRSIGWLNSSLDCLCLVAATRRGCDLIIDMPSSKML
jgi:hypothetical protein